MTYQTLNPVPSTDPRDLDDNAQAFDRFLQSTASVELDRLGQARKTWHQMELDAAALVSPNVSALAAVAASVDKGVFFNSASPVGMGTYALTSFTRNLGSATDQASFRAAIGAMALTDTGAYSGSVAKLTTARTIAVTGDGSWSVSFDGSGNVSAALTLAASGVTAGTYGSVTVNAKGLVVSASTLTPIANGGTNAATAAGARTNLGAAAAGANSDITSLTGLTTPLSLAQGGTGANTAALARTALGVTPGAWANLTLSNSWAVISGRRAAYRSFLDMVQLEVNISAGTATDGTVLFTLPAGSRPAFPQVIPVSSGVNTTPGASVPTPRVLIGTDGTVACFNCTNAPGVSFTAAISTI